MPEQTPQTPHPTDPAAEKPPITGAIKNPAKYRELCVPFENAAAATEAVQAFWRELYDLRVKYKIPDLYVLAGLNVLHEDGEENWHMIPISIGDTGKALSMAAWAFGYEQSQEDARIAKLANTPKVRAKRA